MNTTQTIELIRRLAREYNKPEYFDNDPIIFPKFFYEAYMNKPSRVAQIHKNFQIPKGYKVQLPDIEIVAVIASYLAWGRRNMILRDIKRALDQMGWKPLAYVMAGEYKNEDTSLHRTIKWSDFAAVCQRLREFYAESVTLENLSVEELRVRIFGQKKDNSAANKKIHLLRRWMARQDGVVDLGLWKQIPENELIIPLDTHVHQTALSLGITKRRNANLQTAREITDFLLKAFPLDPCQGDFALFAYAVENSSSKKTKFATDYEQKKK